MFIKYWEQPLLTHLKKLIKYYEIVVFTSLPRAFMEKLLKQCPGLDNLLNIILCSEDSTI